MAEPPVPVHGAVPRHGLDVVVLLSVGRHPASGRPRRAAADAQALEMAFGIAGAAIHAVHAGDPEQEVLRDYLGMGLDRLTVLRTAAGTDPVEALAAHLRSLRPALVLAGRRAEGGEDSGMVPYLVARALDSALVPDVVAVRIEDGVGGGRRVELVQALPRGRRRSLQAAPPLVVTVHPSAPAARPVAFGRARRGMIEVLETAAPPDLFLVECETGPRRPRPRRLPVPRGGSALDRLRAATEVAAGKGQLLIDPSPEDAAARIYDSLRDQGLINATERAMTGDTDRPQRGRLDRQPGGGGRP